MKIGITGPTADRNLGDYAMYVNNVYDMGKENKYFVYTYDFSFTKQLSQDYFRDFDLKYQMVQYQENETRKNKFIKVLKRVKSFLLGLDINQRSYPTDLEIIRKCPNYEQVLESVNDLDVLVVSGGGYFNDLWFNWGRKQDLFRILIPVLAATKLKKKIIFTANGFGPFDTSSKFYEIIFREIQKCEVVISSRDEKYSPLYLRDIGVRNYHSLPDDLYIINEGLMSVQEVEDSKKYILLEMYGGIKEKLKEIKNIAENFIRDGYLVKFVSFDIDPEASACIKKLGIPEFQYIDLKSGYLKFEKILNLINNAELVICNRYHALVLSITSSTPVINVIKPVYDYRYYLNKNTGVLDRAFEGMQYDELDFICFDMLELQNKIFDISDTLKKQNKLYNDNRYITNKLKLEESRRHFFRENFNG